MAFLTVMMTDEELRDALDALYAYDGGATDSGVRDDDLRQRCVQELEERQTDPVRWRCFAAWLVRELWLSEHAVSQGYGLEDAVGFIQWLDRRMGCPQTGL